MHYTQKGKQTFLKTISEKHFFFLTSHEKQATERMVCSGELPPPPPHGSYAPVPIAVSLKNGHAPSWSVGHLQVFPWLVQPVRDLPQLLHGVLKAAPCNTASYSLQLGLQVSSLFLLQLESEFKHTHKPATNFPPVSFSESEVSAHTPQNPRHNARQQTSTCAVADRLPYVATIKTCAPQGQKQQQQKRRAKSRTEAGCKQFKGRAQMPARRQSKRSIGFEFTAT